MKGIELLSESRYFQFAKAQHRKAKDKMRFHYEITTQGQYYLPYEDSLNEDDLLRIRKIADPKNNISANFKNFTWRYKNYEKAHKIFVMLMLSGY